MIRGGLAAGLGVEGEGQLLTAWLSNDDLLLVDGVGGINKLGDVEALVLNLVLAHNNGDLKGLGDTHPLGVGVSQLAGLLLGLSDKGDPVGLGLVLLTAVLVLSLPVAGGSVPAGVAGGHLHGLGLVSKGDLGGGAVSDNILPLVLKGADLPLYELGGFLAHGQDSVEAVVFINHLLDFQGDRGHLLGEGRHTNLSVDGGVGVPAVVLRGVPVAGGVGGCQGDAQGDKEGLE